MGQVSPLMTDGCGLVILPTRNCVRRAPAAESAPGE